MRISGIFEKIKDSVFAVRFETASADELDKAFDVWKNPEALREFFNQYRADLSKFESAMKTKRAVLEVADDAERIFDRLIEAEEDGTMDELFRPLDNREEKQPAYELQRYKLKGKTRKSMLRLYAVKFGNWYIISGSAIKITNRMDRPHLKAELHKLELVKQHLRTEGIEMSFVYLDM